MINDSNDVNTEVLFCYYSESDVRLTLYPIGKFPFGVFENDNKIVPCNLISDIYTQIGTHTFGLLTKFMN